MAKKRRYSFDDGDIVTALQHDLGVGQGDNEGNNNEAKEKTSATPQPQATNNPAEAETNKENKGEADSEKSTSEETSSQQTVNEETEAEQGFRKENQELPSSATPIAQETINTAATVITPVTEKVETPGLFNKDPSAQDQRMEKAAKKFVDTFGRKVKGTNERQHLMITEANKNRLADIKIAFGIYYQDVINNMIEHFFEQHKELIDYKYEKRRHINR